MNYGLQLYSVRDSAKENLLETIEKVAAQGYTCLEFAGFFGFSAEEVKAKMDQCGVYVSGTHTGWESIRDDFEGTVKYHKTIGNKNIIVPGFSYSTKEKVEDFINFLNEFGPKLKAEGITLGYHNHAKEFTTVYDGKNVHQMIEENTDVEFEIDTYWVYAAGLDPVETLERLKDRIRVIHIKDGFADGKGMPLGKGTAPTAAVYAKAKEMGLLMVVESETLTPTGLDEAQICIDYLKGLEA
jgi:sugar phosphate isomerase/epimerase